LGHGSRFWFSLPLRTVAGNAGTPEPVVRRRALVVKRSAASAEILGRILGSLECQTVMAGSCQEALRQAAGAGPFDLIFADHSLAGGKGLDLLQTLGKQKGGRGAIPVVVLDALHLAEGISEGRERGIDRYLLDPVFEQDVRRLLEALASHEAPAPAPAPSTRPLRVLLAEDNAVNRMVATQMLVKRGHTVVSAENGLEAIAAAGRERFDVILMDVQMPQMDGYEATAAIRRAQAAGKQYTPIIALTAHAMIGDREKCLMAGMDEYVSKPLSAEELYSKIALLTGAGWARPSLPESRPPD
jgi:CheY-like chemotaxis protein